jgi:3-oxoacyl-[acyl-carrier protein] reductase
MMLTGCASGIGRHLAGRLAQAGHRLMLTDLNLAALESAAAAEGWDRDRALLRQLDVRDAQGWTRLVDETVERFGDLDVLWNIAGYLRPGYVHELPPEQIALHLETNALGTMLGCHAAARHMVARRRGHIINIGSMAALAPVPGITLYTASKFAVRGFTLALGQELRRYGVAVTLVCPDAVQTPMLDLQMDYPEAALTFSAPRPLTVEALCALLTDKVLRDRPLEVTMPRWRGWLAKATSMWPSLAQALLPYLRKQGLARQKRMQGNGRRDRGSTTLGPIDRRQETAGKA